MYSGSVSARQSTNHNSRYRMLMDTYKFLCNLMKQIPRSSNHSCMHTNTWASTWLHKSPQDTPQGLCPSPLSIRCSCYIPSSKGNAGAGTGRNPWEAVPVLPAQGIPTHCSWGHTCLPGDPHLYPEGLPRGVLQWFVGVLEGHQHLCSKC